MKTLIQIVLAIGHGIMTNALNILTNFISNISKLLSGVATFLGGKGSVMGYFSDGSSEIHPTSSVDVNNIQYKHGKSWHVYSLDIRCSFLTEDTLTSFLNTVYNKIFDGYSNNVTLSLRLVYNKVTQVTVAPYITINKSDIPVFMFIEYFLNAYRIKTNTYNDLNVQSIALVFKLTKQETTLNQEQKLINTDILCNKELSSKGIAFSFGNLKFPLGLDFNLWGLFIENKFESFSNFRTILIKLFKHYDINQSLLLLTILNDKHFQIKIGNLLILIKRDNDILSYSISKQIFSKRSEKIYEFPLLYITYDFIKCEIIHSIKHFNFPYIKPYEPKQKLTINHNSIGQYPLVTYDLETQTLKDGTIRVIAASIYDGSKTYSFFINDYDSSESLINAFLSQLLQYSSAICFAHNSDKFDIVFLLKYLAVLGELKNIIKKNGKFITMEFNNETCKLIFRDSILLMPGSLDKLCKSFKINTLKGCFNHTRTNSCDTYLKFEAIREELVSYCINDSIALFELIIII